GRGGVGGGGGWVGRRVGGWGGWERTFWSCRTSSLGQPFWPRHPGSSIVIPIVGAVDARLSGGRARRHEPRAQRRARDRPSRHFDVCAGPCFGGPYPMRKLSDGKGGSR